MSWSEYWLHRWKFIKHLWYVFFSTQVHLQSAFHILGFHIHRFNQLWNTNSIFDPQVEICGFRGPTVCIVLLHFIKGFQHLWILVSIGSWNQFPCGYEGITVLPYFFFSKCYRKSLPFTFFVMNELCSSCSLNHKQHLLSSYKLTKQRVLNQVIKLKCWSSPCIL